MLRLSDIGARKRSRVVGVVFATVALWGCGEQQPYHDDEIAGTHPIQVGPAPVETNLVSNGSFENGTDDWFTLGTVPNTLVVKNAELCVDIPAGTANRYDVLVGQTNLDLDEGAGYEMRFTARSSVRVGITAAVGESGGQHLDFGAIDATLDIAPAQFSKRFVVPASKEIPEIVFQLGGADFEWTFCLDDVVVVPLLEEHLINGSFDQGTTGWWMDAFIGAVDTSSGRFCTVVPGGTRQLDGRLGQDIALQRGRTYYFSLFAAGDPEPFRVDVRDPAALRPLQQWNPTPSPTGGTYSFSFTPGETIEAAKIIFLLGGTVNDRNICLDNISLLGGAAVPTHEPDTGPRVRVNQVAYLRFGPKDATLVTDATKPLPFYLVDAEGQVRLEGETVPFGLDASSKLNVHTIDFSSFTEAGGGFVVAADGDISYPFDVGGDDFEALRVDALSFYYPQRSGIPIDGDIAGAPYARPAGHASAPASGAPNQGDLAVPCQPADDALLYYGEPWTCDYTLDVIGGWYDAGDHGKYVVNGGIAAFQLMNAFERTKRAPTADAGALGDDTLRIPESENTLPDILDEARYELEFLLSMMVPDGKPLAGMVHHKVHDFNWTGLPLLPHEDPNLRWLHRPSTAATLDLAAVAAQGARLFALYDATFADRLLTAAQKAYAAAVATPNLFAPAADGANGGNPYDDGDVTDEFYWAATELYLTTSAQAYLDDLLASPLHTAEIFTHAGFSFANVAALARMDLAAVPSALPDREAVIDSVVDGALGYLDDAAANGFGHPYAPTDGVYRQGSNGQILNNLVVLGTAYDLTGNDLFRRAVLRGIDYILGRNALNRSYVTGYGTLSATHQHSRWYAHQLDPWLPPPPRGTVSGGPNAMTDTWDPIMASLFPNRDCAPQRCYVDDIHSWSTNALAINWNASLAWIASFVADQDAGDTPEPACSVTYNVLTAPAGSNELTATVQLTNDSADTLYDWTLSWSFFGNQTIESARGAKVVQTGAEVALISPDWDSLPPEASRVYIVRGDRGGLAVIDPGVFFLNGSPCRLK